jgi:hypothetical protein
MFSPLDTFSLTQFWAAALNVSNGEVPADAVISMRPPLVARPLRLRGVPSTTTDCGAQNLAAGEGVADQEESGTGIVTEGLAEATAVSIVSITFVFRLRAVNVTLLPLGA